jgi:hypothetical protein
MGDELPAEGALTPEQVRAEVQRAASDVPRASGPKGDATSEASDADFRSLDDAKALLGAAQTEGERLFAGTDGAELLDLLEARTLMGLSPEAEVQAHAHMAAFLADLARLRRDAPAGAESALAPEAFEASLDAALHERGIDRRQLNELEEQLFMGAPAAYRHILKYLESMPPGARLAARVRSVDALLMWRRLEALQQDLIRGLE